MTRQLSLWLVLTGLVLLSGVVIFEVLLRLLAPQPYIYPRYQYSERYAQLPYPSTVMVAEAPGQWRFTYTTDEYSLRIPTVAVSSRYDLPNVVVLGDSYSFGNGVNDGEQYPAVLGDLLAGRAHVVNLGVPGFGLTQQIRFFYEFGRAFDPAIVLVQFTNNDPDDNLFYKVTEIRDGRFVFRHDRSLGPVLRLVKDFLGSSIVQRSQVYNYVRNLAYETLRERAVARTLRQDGDAGREPTVAKQDFHDALLELFVDDLDRRGIKVVLFGVQGHLAQFPRILAEVEQLQDRGLLTYVASEPWFRGMADYGSPEGHEWGARAHRIVAERLAPILAAMLPQPDRGPAATSALTSGPPAPGAW